ncbi:MAG: hypothetical protein PPP55_07265 [Halorubrum sp.]
MIRVVVTVAVAVALLAASTPALEDARTATTVDRIETEAERIERAAGGVAAGSIAVDETRLAASAGHRVHAPSGFAAAPIHRLTLANVADVEDGSVGGASMSVEVEAHDPAIDVVLIYRLRDGPARMVPVHNPSDAIGLTVSDGPLELRTAGASRIGFRLLDSDDGPTVRVLQTG